MQISLAEGCTTISTDVQVSGFSSLRYTCDLLLNIKTKLNPLNNVTLSIAPSLGQEMDYEQLSSNVEVNDLELTAGCTDLNWDYGTIVKHPMDTSKILKKSVSALESIKSK